MSLESSVASVFCHALSNHNNSDRMLDKFYLLSLEPVTQGYNIEDPNGCQMTKAHAHSRTQITVAIFFCLNQII